MHGLVELLDHVHRDADRARLVGDRSRHRLPDPPGRVGGELVALAVVELLDCADEAERALLDEVEEREAAAEVALGDRDDEAQVGLDHRLLGAHVAALDALGEHDFLLGREQGDAADRAQVEAQGVERGLDGEVELGPLLGGRDVRRGIAGALENVDAVVDQIRVQVFDLFLRDLHLFEHGGDLRVR